MITADEKALLESGIDKLQRHNVKNVRLEKYYNGKDRVDDLGISTPPALSAVKTVAGIPETVVSVLEERLDLESFGADSSDDPYGLHELFVANNVDTKSSLAHIDSLVHGTGFVTVGRGLEGEPDPLITVEPPTRITGEYDLRTNRLKSAVSFIEPNPGEQYATLYLPNETIWLELRRGQWADVERDVHNLGRVPVVQLVNQPRSGTPKGRSEITRVIRYLTDATMRTLLGAEVAREFYSAPQRWVMGAKEEWFTDSDGNPLDKWSVVQGRVLVLPEGETEGKNPTVGQFDANSPAPYIELINKYLQLVASAAGIPAPYLGFTTDNPASADAIRAGEARLVKRAERRQKQFGAAWAQVADLAMRAHGETPPPLTAIQPTWRSASTPTEAATADALVKLAQSGVLQPNSEVILSRLGLTETQKQTVRAEWRRASALGFAQSLSEVAGLNAEEFSSGSSTD